MEAKDLKFVIKAIRFRLGDDDGNIYSDEMLKTSIKASEEYFNNDYEDMPISMKIQFSIVWCLGRMALIERAREYTLQKELGATTDSVSDMLLKQYRIEYEQLDKMIEE